METNLDLSRQAFGWDFLGRTWVMVMLAILVLALAMPLWRTLRGLRTGQAADAASVAKPVEAPAGHPLHVSGPCGCAHGSVCRRLPAGASVEHEHELLPVVTSVSGLAVALLAIGADLMRWRAGTGRAQQDGDTLAVLTMFGMLIGMVALSMLVGQYIALPLTVALFLAVGAPALDRHRRAGGCGGVDPRIHLRSPAAPDLARAQKVQIF